MVILEIEHGVKEYNAWKKAFDDDLAGRGTAGVRTHRVLRPIDDPVYVVVHLHFDNSRAAAAFRATLEDIWKRGESGKVITRPKSRIIEDVETIRYPEEPKAST